MSLGFGPKIYLRGAIPIYSYMVAIGHRPPLGRSFSFGFISLSLLYGNMLMFGLIWFYLHVCKHEHFVPHSVNLLHPKPISSTNLLKISMTCPLHHICWSGRGGPETPGFIPETPMGRRLWGKYRWRGSTQAMPMLEGFRDMKSLWDPANSTEIRQHRETWDLPRFGPLCRVKTYVLLVWLLLMMWLTMVEYSGGVDAI
jgi:hypothetical protein